LSQKNNSARIGKVYAGGDFIVAIDTGGMHRANMLGCPLVCMYGAINPLVTGPIYESNKIIAMLDICPENDDFNAEDGRVDSVFKAV
jgi:heptosyltransferase-2